MKEYRTEIKVKNNLILSKIEELGYLNPHNFCEKTGFSYEVLNSFINFKRKTISERLNKKGDFKDSFMELCDILGCMPEELVTSSQIELQVKTNKVTRLVEQAEINFFLECGSKELPLLENDIFKELKNNKTLELLELLPNRLKGVLERRFGIFDGTEWTLQKVGEWLGVSRNKVMNLQDRGIRMLRQTRRSEEFKRNFIDEQEDE